MRAAVTSWLGLLGACATFAPRPADPGLFLLPPSEAGRRISLAQSVRMTSNKGASFEALAAVEVEPRWLRVAALGPMGNRIMFLEWDGRHYEEERDPHIPNDFPLKVVLRDLELALFPAAAVRKGLPTSGWSLWDGARTRELRLEGKPVIHIDYSTDDRWDGAIHFHHLTLGYELEIRPASVD